MSSDIEEPAITAGDGPEPVPSPPQKKAFAEGGLAAKLVLGLLLLAAIGIFVPIHTEPAMGDEYWWPVAVSEAFLSNRQHGVGVVDTHGPWGFVVGGYHPDTLALSTAIWGIITVVAFLAVWDIGRRGARRWPPAAMLIVLVLFTSIVCWSEFLITLWTFIFLVRTLEFPEARNSPLGIALVALSGLLALVKFSTLLAMAVILVLVTADDLIRRLKPVSLAVWISSVAFFWLAAGQSPSAFPEFVRWSMKIVAAYSEGMAFDAELYQPWTFAPFIVSAGLFAVALPFVRGSGGTGSVIIRTLAIWANLFFLFKWGFVRADHFHIAPAIGVLLVLQALFTFVWWSGGHCTGRRWLAIPLAISISIPAWLAHGFVSKSLASEAGKMVSQAYSGVRRLADWQSYERGLTSNHWKAMAMLPPVSALSLAEGTVDSYPAITGIVLREEVELHPRPVFRSYNVFTPELARLNADHLRSSPPDVVVFGIAPADRRYPSLEDGASWPILLSRYGVAGVVGKAVVLRKREGVAPDAGLVMVKSLECRLGEALRLPEAGGSPLYARISIDLSTRGRILKLLYKPPDLEIEVQLANGAVRKRKLVREMAQSEFLLSPYIDTAEKFARLFPESGPMAFAGEEVRQLRVSAKGNDDAYVPRYTVTLWSAVSP